MRGPKIVEVQTNNAFFYFSFDFQMNDITVFRAKIKIFLLLLFFVKSTFMHAKSRAFIVLSLMCIDQSIV